jgi:N-acetylglutamate synthase-like GNAT family acetyltransferase
MRIEIIENPCSCSDDLINELVNVGKVCFEKSIAYILPIFRKQFNKHNAGLIVLRDTCNKIQGYCSYFKKNKQTIAIGSIAVHPAFQGRNLGLKMLNGVLCSLNKDDPYQLILECQPYLENFYKKIGFSVIKPPVKNYYYFERYNKQKAAYTIFVPAIIMSTSNLKLYEERSHHTKLDNNTNPQQDFREKIIFLIDFVSLVKKSTSFWYSGFWHSSRKEKAFDAIYAQLNYMLDPEITRPTEAMLVDVLRAVIANALIIRGSFAAKTAITKSSQKILDTLNSADGSFANLRKIIQIENQLIEHQDLINFSGYKTSLHSDEFTIYPYSHFSKQR